MSAPTRNRTTYAAASKLLLRTSLLDGLRDLLRVKDWAQVTMSDVAKHAGVSRQTVYNEFSSRNGLAQAYALRLVEQFTTEIEAALESMPGDVEGALTAGFAGFFSSAGQDPMIASLLSGEAKPDLLKLITTDSAPLIESASARLDVSLRESWIRMPAHASGRIARMITRLAISYVSMPPEADFDVAADLAAVMTPAIIAARG
ncbi:putative transcriptional regulator, TetR family protein [Gordonia spumicola]|uniref:Putative transcriptional regulator, TetR family protein n=1 Tax=Gordonia spumicola TaxID=589161 RepID=A0A7I9V934_9ACTN|nr:TetR family transcriptional regulator [Gordonia spumicola]GEE01603.1 putative transcriptional regulator, TetR family protein [Gordonia spumicola]